MSKEYNVFRSITSEGRVRMLETATRAGYVVTGGSGLSSVLAKGVGLETKVVIATTIVAFASGAATLACGLSAARIRTAHFGINSENVQPFSEASEVTVEGMNKDTMEELERTLT